MADNTDEDHKDNLTNIQLENTSNEITPVNAAETINPNQETENMEVHHHGHVHQSKKWKEYLFQFLMLFFAVFLGFLSEYQLEHVIEHTREKEYMISLVHDVTVDKENLANAIKKKSNEVEIADSLFNLFKSRASGDSNNEIYYFGKKLMDRTLFYMTDGTIQQLKNAGGLRLIRKQEVVDSIQAYINLYNQLTATQQLEESQVVDYRHAASKIFDVYVFEKMISGIGIKKPDNNPKLVSTAKGDLNDMLMKVHSMKRNKIWNLNEYRKLQKKAISLSDLIVKEYHLHNSAAD